MKRFLKKLGIGVLVLSALPICFTAIFLCTTVEYSNMSYVAAIADKVERAEEIDEPKIILIGNSNVAFGIDSELLEDIFDMPVVNMGLHGGLGNKLIEDIAKEYINENDIVIIAHSSYSDDGKMVDPTLAWPMLLSNYDIRTIILENNLLQVIKALPSYMLETSISYMRGIPMYSEVYARSSFNEYGDIAYERIECEYEFIESDGVIAEISEATIERLNEYNIYCEEIGATLLVAGYPIADGEYTVSVEDIEKFQEELEEKLDCEVISNYTDYLINYDYFYNTTLHLNTEGAIIRTNLLIEDLEKVLN